MSEHFLSYQGDLLLVGWDLIAGYFRLSPASFRERFEHELREEGIIFTSKVIAPGKPVCWQSRLRRWVVEKCAIGGEIL